jgi:cathepsin X
MGFFRVELGKDLLGIENNIAWATPGVFSSSNYPCWENGGNCGIQQHIYLDPSRDTGALQSRLLQ